MTIALGWCGPTAAGGPENSAADKPAARLVPRVWSFPARKLRQLCNLPARQRPAGAAPGVATLMPKVAQHGWCKSPLDPCTVLASFPELRLKKGYTLRAYIFASELGDAGVVWAVPAGSEWPEPAELAKTSRGVPAKPPAALADFMEAIEGDGSPWSYLCASMLRRELIEFGASWHGVQWGAHTLLDADPLRDPSDLTGEPSRWKWAEARPQDWRPQVREDGGRTIVTFYTYGRVGQEAIYRHVDRYEPGSYRCRSEVARIATGPRMGLL